jgi:hypothetical protein
MAAAVPASRPKKRRRVSFMVRFAPKSPDSASDSFATGTGALPQKPPFPVFS